MTTTLKFIWSFAVDGGGVGDHLMRGSRIPDFSFYLTPGVAEIQAVGFGAGSTINFKTESGTDLFGYGFDSTSPPGAAPDFWASPSTTAFIHLPPAEYLIMTIGVADLTAGQLEVVMEAAEF